MKNITPLTNTDPVDENVLYPLYSYLSQQDLDTEEIFIHNKNSSNHKGKLWEKFIRNKINEFILNNPEKLRHVENLEIIDGFILRQIYGDNYFIKEETSNIKSELDGLYELYDKRLLIVESKSTSKSTNRSSKYQIKTRIVENATTRKSVFLKIRPTENETLGLISIHANCRKILLKNPTILQKIQNNNATQNLQESI